MTEYHIELKKINKSDIEELQKLSKETYFETFAWGNTSENMKTYLEVSFSNSKLSHELNEVNSHFYFATYDNKTVGYLKINFGQAQTDLKESNGAELERIYVLKEYHGKKIGQFLIDKAFEIAINNKMEYIWLGVWNRNTKAISFYEKNNFVLSGSHSFIMGTEEQTDLIMKRNLK